MILAYVVLYEPHPIYWTSRAIHKLYVIDNPVKCGNYKYLWFLNLTNDFRGDLLAWERERERATTQWMALRLIMYLFMLTFLFVTLQQSVSLKSLRRASLFILYIKITHRIAHLLTGFFIFIFLFLNSALLARTLHWKREKKMLLNFSFLSSSHLIFPSFRATLVYQLQVFSHADWWWWHTQLFSSSVFDETLTC